MPRHRAETRHLRTGVAGLAVVLGLWCTGDSPTPPATAQRAVAEHPVPRAAPAPPEAADPESRPRALPASAPVRLTIGAIGVEDRLMTLDRRPDRTLEVPPEHPGAPAGWYRRSPTPGEAGPAVLLGHVNATGGGAGVFADLHRLTIGDRIAVARADGSTAEFAVDAVERYAKDSFPTLQVYGNTAGPELRLITCDGYDPETGAFDENLVVHASLVRS
ncbi:class F sortase [Kocuria sediminis]|uniref:class F sortase n=1 Tax=Kocuria sediminis TaxID=1038857 RepID=UPI003520A3BE